MLVPRFTRGSFHGFVRQPRRAARVGRRVAATRASSGMRSSRMRRRRRRSRRGADRLGHETLSCPNQTHILALFARHIHLAAPGAEPACLQAIPGVFECRERLSENRGVPGSSPGLATFSPAWLRDSSATPRPAALRVAWVHGLPDAVIGSPVLASRPRNRRRLEDLLGEVGMFWAAPTRPTSSGGLRRSGEGAQRPCQALAR